MLWLIDEGDSYHQMIKLVVQGEEDPKGIIGKYREQLDAHCKEANQLEGKAKKAAGKEPKLRNTRTESPTFQADYDKWQATYRNWRFRVEAYIEKHLTNPAPCIETMLRTEFVIHDFNILRLDR